MRQQILHNFKMTSPGNIKAVMFEFGINESGVEYVSVGKRNEDGRLKEVEFSYEEFIILFAELATMMQTKEFASVMMNERYINAATDIQIGAEIVATYNKK